ncbi:MAG: hypothetical protein ABW133_12545, partial [Polyangiaceae bacterium]
SISGSVESVVQGAQASVQASTGGPMVTGALTACVVGPLKSTMDAAASLKANVNVSVEVKASAEAKGSAKSG